MPPSAETDSPPPRLSDVRSSTDLDAIYRSVSNVSVPISHNSHHTESLGGEQIGNSLSFFANEDPQESRFSTDHEQDEIEARVYDGEEEGDYNEPNGTNGANGATNSTDPGGNANENNLESENNGQKTTSLTSTTTTNHPANTTNAATNTTTATTDDSRHFSFIPSMFRQTTDDKRMFNLFRKKPKDKKQLANYNGQADQELEADSFTGQRASQLVASLVFGAPLLSLLASCLLEDETGISRAPLLMSLLGFRVVDISNTIFTKNRKFRIDLEYGVGPQRMKWSVERSAKDLLYLHSRLKLDHWRKEGVRNRNSDLPKYPIPPLRKNERKRDTRRRFKGQEKDLHSVREGDDDNDQDDDDDDDDEGYGSGNVSDGDHDGDHDVRSGLSVRQLLSLASTMTNLSENSFESVTPEVIKARIAKNQEYITQVENYLRELSRVVSLKPQSNKIFHFFEISPISSLLNYESGYIGKQGTVHIGGTAKSQGWRVGHFRANDLKRMIDRRLEKWFLVRGSYVMFVSSINSTSPLEVFLVDHKFKISYKGDQYKDKDKEDEESDYDDASMLEKKLSTELNSERTGHIFKHLKIVLENSERKLSLLPKSEREQKFWIKSLYEMKNSTVWSKKNRFDSFAPVRDNCYAQWFVDGRDYFWAISSAIEMAKDVVFIHDWWLSPELYLRRPANGNQQFRIDRLLQRKAKQGVKIFVIIYRNVGSTVSTDSLYTKHSLLSLDEDNIHVIRSPNQLLQNTFFWAHHEKLCIVDHTVAFIGGIDLCYGRFDTPDHVLVDDSPVNFNFLNNEHYVPTEEDFINFQIFPGKDYSNPRVKDFFGLDKPYENMYDRNVTPRMPWHDVHMLTSGKVARDLSRHFVQRWNYLLRQKRPSRFTPLLTPPSDFTEEEEAQLNLGGTCEVQLLRSSGNWSLGLKEHEQSIQNAYLKLIETSEHFVYIENQFFITSCEIDGNEIENRIGDALVDRIIRAHNEGTNWKAIVIIPLMPGFESQVDQPDASSVRVIMECQYMSISRGSTSIHAKLRKYGIEPEDYIQFYSLRKWGRIGPDRNLVTEQLYIHAKIMLVDDKIAIIGSANINERSMRGIRDSEMAAIVRDRETIYTKMDGKDYKAGKFAHTLRMRLMREHLGVNVDVIDIVDRRFKRYEDFASTPEGIKAATNNFKNKEYEKLSAMVEIASRDILNQPKGTFRWTHYKDKRKSNDESNDNKDIEVEPTPMDDINELEKENPAPLPLPVSFNNRTGSHEANKGIRDKKKHSYDTRVQYNEGHKRDVYGLGIDKYKSKLAKRARLNSTRFLKDLAQKTMKVNPVGTVLPELEEVMEFLESDDFDMSDEMDDESEEIIFERNKERWNLLKKISYLQRIVAIERENEEIENKKRAKAGLNTNVTNGGVGVSNGKGDQQDNGSTNDINEKVTGAIEEDDSTSIEDEEINLKDSVAINANGKANSNIGDDIKKNGKRRINGSGSGSGSGSAGTNKSYPMPFSSGTDLNTTTSASPSVGTPKKKGLDIHLVHGRKEGKLHNKEERNQNHRFDSRLDSNKFEASADYSENVPIVSLTEAGVKAIIHSINPKHAENFTRFIDPYLFEDPISIDFYEDLWYEHARRNTEIFRMIFHCQPDDHVTSWREYKQSTKLQKAFIKAQVQEAKRRKNKPLFGEENETDSNSYTENGGDNSAEVAENGTTTASVTATATDDEDDRSVEKKKSIASFSARRRAAAGDRIFDRETADRILSEIQGHLVLFPTDWLLRELEGGNWFYNTDRIPPIDIYD